MTRRILLLAFIILGVAAPAAQASDVTILFGRAILYDADSACSPLPGTATLYEAASGLALRGVSAVTEPSVGFTAEHAPTCIGSAAYASWDDLQRLHSVYGWEAVSAGDGRDDLTTLPDDAVRSESCGTLPIFEAHGFDRAWGLFAYPGNDWDDHTQAIVNDCYAYGRTYRGKWNALNGSPAFLSLAAPWYARTNSMNGGACNDPSLSCYDLDVKNDRRYDSVPDAQSYVREADAWTLIQVYRLRTGSGDWGDCTGPWASHWTLTPEDYCLADLFSIVDAIPSSARVTDPARVAQELGRHP